MALISGLAGQFGFQAEVTWGVLETPVTRFVQFVDESVQLDVERLESDSIIAGQRVMRSSQWTPALKKVGGDVGLEVFDGGQGLLWYHALGSATWSVSSGVMTATYTPGDLQGKGLTLSFGRPSRSGTVVPFHYSGAKVASWEASMDVGSIATAGFTFLGKAETTGIALPAAVFDADVRPLNFVNGSLTIAGSDLCVRSATISGDNSLADDRVCFGQDTIDEPAEVDLREYTASFEVEFGDQGDGSGDLGLYNRYVEGAEAALDLTLANSAGTGSLRFLGNLRYDGQTPSVGGKEILTYELSGRFVGTTDDATGLTVVQVSPHDTSP